MALQVNEPITTIEGIDLESHYLRIEPKLCICGTRLEVEWSYYISKTLFQEGNRPFIPKEHIFRKQAFTYDRLVDGTDIVSVAHDKLVGYLTTSQGTDNDGNPLPPVYALENVSIVDI